MSKGNPFIMDMSEYKRSMNPLETAVDVYVTFAMKKYNINEDNARELIKKLIEKKGFQNPMVEYNHKDLRTLDMEESTCRLTDYLSMVTAPTVTLAPSLTSYTKVDKDGRVWESMQSKWTDRNKVERKVFKSKARIARSEGDILTFKINNTLQKAKKMNNNTLSGASSILIYPQSRHSTHYSLTSYTSTVTSTANIMTESMVMGNRLYITPSDVLNHFTSILKYHDRDKCEIANKKYNLYIPTVDDIISMVLYNTLYYWRDDDAISSIREYVETFTPLERTMVMYQNDLYHLTLYNKNTIESALTIMTTPTMSLSTDIEIVKNAAEYEQNLMHHVLMDELRGKGLNYDSFKGSELGAMMASTILRIRESLEDLTPLIKAYFQSNVLPPNVDKMKLVVRRAIILSDTDSTCAHYTTMLKNRYGDDLVFNQSTVGYAAALSLFNAETTASALKLLCKNMNIDEDKMSSVSMKSEFFWSIFVPTEGSKHYFERAHVQEKEILDDLDRGTKGHTTPHGVGLIANQTLEVYNDFKMELIHDVANTLEQNKLMSLREKIDMIIELENGIIDAINNGDSNVLTTDNISNPEAYKLSWDKTKYKFHAIYDRAFSDKYGKIAEPPYRVYKLNVKIEKTKDFLNWIADIEDDEIRNALLKYHEEYPINSMSQFLLPVDIVKSKGIPDEFKHIIDYTRAVEMLLSPIYTIMDTLGVYKRDGMLYKDFM